LRHAPASGPVILSADLLPEADVGGSFAQLRYQSAVALEGMNDSDGNTITPEYSVTAAMQSSALAIKHYPDPQAMPDAQLVLSTVNADAAALRRLRTMAFKVHQMRVKATNTGRRWMNLLEKGRDIQYSTLDMQSETPTLKKPRGEMGPPGTPGQPGVKICQLLPTSNVACCTWLCTCC